MNWLSGKSHAEKHAQTHTHAPTLTEVVEAWESSAMPLDGQRPEAAVITDSFCGRWDASTNAAVAAQGDELSVRQAAVPAVVINDDQIIQRVMLELQRQIDLMLEVRLREALLPVLARATDAIVLESRNELASTLRAVVSTAVTQELARHRKV
jgi:hypothetical protein